MEFWILNDPNKNVPESRRYVASHATEESVKLNRKQLSYLLGRMEKECHTGRIWVYLVTWLFPWFAYNIHAEKDDAAIIYMCPRRDLLSSFTHEMLHILYENATEGEVLAIEQQMGRMMSPKQWLQMYDMMTYSIHVAPRKTNMELLRMFVKADPRRAKILTIRQRKEFKKGKVKREYAKEELARVAK